MSIPVGNYSGDGNYSGGDNDSGDGNDAGGGDILYIEPDQVERLSELLREHGTAVRDQHAPELLPGVAEAIPGSATAGACTRLAAALRLANNRVAHDITRTHFSIRGSVDGYCGVVSTTVSELAAFDR